MNTTDRFRWLGWVLWTILVIAALAGWLWFDRDPSQLAPVLGWVTGAVGIGEASNLGKRATDRELARIKSHGPSKVNVEGPSDVTVEGDRG